MRVPKCLHIAGIFLLVAYHLSEVQAAKSKAPSTTEFKMPSLLETLANVLQDRAILRSGPEKSKSLTDVLNKHRPKTGKLKKYSITTTTTTTTPPKGALRSDLLRQELAKETGENCLAKLLCGPSVASNKKPFSPVRDYAHLVKEFFELFGVDELEEEDSKKDETKKDDEEKSTSNDDDDEDEGETEGRSDEKNTVNITASLEDIISTSTSATITTVTTGATITEIPSPAPPPKPKSSPFEDTKMSEIHKVTLEELIGDVMLTPEDFQNMRRSRALFPVKELRQSKYIRRKLRELKLAKSESRKLRIAGQIASSMRQPRQCQQFDKVASEILSTCPLTSEVVRYFNSNLKNGSQIAIVKNHPNATEGGLVLLNDHGDRPHSYFLDNSPVVSSTKINQDLKNPTTPDRFVTDLEYQIYDKTFPSKVDPNQISITQPKLPKKSPNKKNDVDDDVDAESSENDDDEEDDNDDEEDDDDGEEEDENEDEGQSDNNSQTEEDNEHDEEFQNEYDDVVPYRRGNEQGRTSQKPKTKEQGRKWKITKKRRKQIAQKQKNQQIKKKAEATRPKVTRPSGMIKVYGIPQPSFDNEFTHISHQIGQGPVVIFDQDDYDANAPYPPGSRPPVRNPPSRPKSNKIPLQRQRQQSPANQRWSKGTKKTTAKPQPQSSEEDEEEEEEENYSRSSYNNINNQYPQQQTRGGPSPHYMTSAYGSYPAPRPEEYYRNGLPPRPRPVPSASHFRPVGNPMNIRPEASVRGRLNFMPNPGSGLIRPFYNGNSNYY